MGSLLRRFRSNRAGQRRRQMLKQGVHVRVLERGLARGDVAAVLLDPPLVLAPLVDERHEEVPLAAL
jgi:hypothetical protein